MGHPLLLVLVEELYTIYFYSLIQLTLYMNDILTVLRLRGYSSDNIAFGSGGWLIQGS